MPGAPWALHFQVSQLPQLPASRAADGLCDQGQAQPRALGGPGLAKVSLLEAFLTSVASPR